MKPLSSPTPESHIPLQMNKHCFEPKNHARLKEILKGAAPPSFFLVFFCFVCCFINDEIQKPRYYSGLATSYINKRESEINILFTSVWHGALKNCCQICLICLSRALCMTRDVPSQQQSFSGDYIQRLVALPYAKFQ